MANKTLADLPVASNTANADITHIQQGGVDKSLSHTLLANFVLRNSDYADVIETRTADNDYLAADLEPNHIIFVNQTAGDITLGFFNGSDRNGAVVIIQVIGTANVVNIELASSGTTDIVLKTNSTLKMIWDDTNSVWRIDQGNLITETRTADHDYLAEEFEHDLRIFADSTSVDITLGLFNGSVKDGAIITIIANGTGGNLVNIELVSGGTTDIVLVDEDILLAIWDDSNSEWKVIYTKFGLKQYLEVSVTQNMITNKKYITEGNIDLTLPSLANKGDVIKVFPEDTIKILQGDAENVISYLNKHFTTKGASGYLQVPSKAKLELVYEGAGFNRVEPGIKISDPSSLPTLNPRGSDWSSNDLYMALADSVSPYIIIYKRSGDTFTKLSNPATLPTGSGYDVSFSYDNVYLAVAHVASPYITIYKRSGDTFTKLSDPATLPTGNGRGCAFSYDGNYLAVVHATSPYITIYKRSGDTFTKLSDPATLPTGEGRSCSWSYDGNYLAVAHDTSPYITIYKRNGDTFTKITNPSTLPTGDGRGCFFSLNGLYLAVAHVASPYITIYKIDNISDTFVKLPNPASLPGIDAGACIFSYDSKYLVFVEGLSPYFGVYKIDGDTFTKLSNPITIPGGTGLGCSFSYNNQYTVITSNTANYLFIYKNVEAVTKSWLVQKFNTLYEQDLEYLFK